MKIFIFLVHKVKTSFIYRINKNLKNYITDCDPLCITFVISTFFQAIALMTNSYTFFFTFKILHLNTSTFSLNGKNFVIFCIILKNQRK